MIFRVLNPRSPANGDGRAAEIGAEFNAHLSPWPSARTPRSEKYRHRVCRVTRSCYYGGPSNGRRAAHPMIRREQGGSRKAELLEEEQRRKNRGDGASKPYLQRHADGIDIRH